MNSLDEFIADWDAAMAKMPDWFHLIFGSADGFWHFILNNSVQGLVIGALGWLLVTYLERRHFKELEARQEALKHITLSTSKRADDTATGGVILIGSTVVSHDFLRSFLIQLRKLIGGNFGLYDRLMARGRMEAMTRMQEEAAARGLNRIVGVRFSGSTVAGKMLATVEIVVYGTGIQAETPKS